MKTITNNPSKPNKMLFLGCFVALLTTVFGFITRVFLVDTWSVAFDLDPAQARNLLAMLTELNNKPEVV